MSSVDPGKAFDYSALVDYQDGTAAITVGGTVHEVAAPGAMIMPAGVPHSLRAAERFKMVLTMIRARKEGKGEEER